jgi:hypothetical protein
MLCIYLTSKLDFDPSLVPPAHIQEELVVAWSGVSFREHRKFDPFFLHKARAA